MAVSVRCWTSREVNVHVPPFFGAPGAPEKHVEPRAQEQPSHLQGETQRAAEDHDAPVRAEVASGHLDSGFVGFAVEGASTGDTRRDVVQMESAGVTSHQQIATSHGQRERGALIVQRQFPHRERTQEVVSRIGDCQVLDTPPTGFANHRGGGEDPSGDPVVLDLKAPAIPQQPKDPHPNSPRVNSRRSRPADSRRSPEQGWPRREPRARQRHHGRRPGVPRGRPARPPPAIAPCALTVPEVGHAWPRPSAAAKGDRATVAAITNRNQ